MSTGPLFISEPTLNAATVVGDDAEVDLVPTTTEPTLIEEIIVASQGSAWLPGRAIIFVYQTGPGGDRPVKVQIIDAAGADGADQRFPLNVTLPVGMKLRVQHNTQLVAGGNATLYFTALGGILR